MRTRSSVKEKERWSKDVWLGATMLWAQLGASVPQGDHDSRTPGKRAPGFIGGRPPPLRRLARRFPTTTFMILTFVITWVVWVPRALASQRYLHSEWPVTIGPFSTYEPAVAAVLAAALSGGRARLPELGSRLIRWRARWWLYLVVLLGPAAFWMCVVAVNALGGSSERLARPILAEQGWRAAVLLFFFLAATDGVGETGWRGYACRDSSSSSV
jgi:hypothetical protein